MKPICSCLICKKEVPVKGIHTHNMRTHEKVGFKGSTGYNGKYSDPSYKQSIVKTRKLALEERKGKYALFEVECAKCATAFSVNEREKEFPNKKKYYCSRACANSRVVTEDQKRKTSESLSGRRYVTPHQVTRICMCGAEFITSNRNKNKHCSRSCSSKYSEKQQLRHKKARENRPALINYRKDCAFNFNLADYPEEFDFTLIEQFGWYKPKNKGNNLSGVSRDHLVSVRYGFDNNLPPEHLAHPANCALMQHGDNVSKGIKNSISYEDLLKRIDIWNSKYPPNNPIESTWG